MDCMPYNAALTLLVTSCKNFGTSSRHSSNPVVYDLETMELKYLDTRSISARVDNGTADQKHIDVSHQSKDAASNFLDCSFHYQEYQLIKWLILMWFLLMMISLLWPLPMQKINSTLSTKMDD